MNTSLDHLHPNQSGTIIAIEAGPELTRRMSALGLRLGRRVEVLRIAPLQGPLQIRVGHTELMIRRIDAAKINIQLGASTL
jgi:Fe2+ transport system protein A